MLGSGRPFLIEISNARCIPSKVDIELIAEKLNRNDQKYVSFLLYVKIVLLLVPCFIMLVQLNATLVH